jgi:hypothetical protein
LESTSKERISLLDELYSKYNMELKLLLNYNILIEKEKCLYKHLNILKEYDFIIRCLELFNKNTLGSFYVVSNMDFRGRIFPVGRILHRATGIYKDLLIPIGNQLSEDYEYITFTYNSQTKLLLKEYISFLILDKKDGFTKKDLVDYFNNNICIAQKNKAIFSNMLIFINNIIKINNQDLLFNSTGIILKTISNKNIYGNFKNSNDEIFFQEYSFYIYKILKDNIDKRHKLIFAFKEYFSVEIDPYYLSNFHIEIDQSSSGPQIYALLSNDKKMANITNLISNKKGIKMDIYNDFLKIFKKDFRAFCDLNNNIIGIKILKKKINKIFTRKNFAKLIIMPKFYNMSDKGTRELLDSLDIPPNIKNIKNELVKIINNILDKKYENTMNYQRCLVDIAEILYDKNYWINIRLLDGSSIKYKYIEMKESFGKIYSPNKKPISYRIYLPLDELEDETKNPLDKKHYTTFPPNFVHALDGAICRLIITVFYKLYKIILEPLHDSFRIPLRLYYNLQEVIKYVYIFIFYNRYFHKHKIGLSFDIDNNNNDIAITYENKRDYKNKYIPNFKIGYNSNNYEEYKNMLPVYNFKDDDILINTIANRVNEEGDIDELIIDKIKDLNKRCIKKTTNDKMVKGILESEFMFYF